jgi:hypothetical protein
VLPGKVVRFKDRIKRNIRSQNKNLCGHRMIVSEKAETSAEAKLSRFIRKKKFPENAYPALVNLSPSSDSVPPDPSEQQVEYSSAVHFQLED